MKSIFCSAQRYNWANFDRFLFGIQNESDYVKTASEIKSHIVHDCGVDDMIAVEYFKKDLEKIKEDEKFLAIYNSNALHAPYQEDSKYLKNENKSNFRYENALFIVDNAWKKNFEFFEEKKLLEDTIIIFTGDHSTCLDNRNVRIYSMRKDSLNIPFFIIFPEKFIKRHQDLFNKIKSNENVLASNIDIIPTIISLLELEEGNEEIIKLLDGKSLFSDIEKRNIYILNNTEFRRTERECFAIYSDEYSFAFMTYEKELIII